jgi:membrane-associated protease RseP (regulator of RpoE activity)
MSILSDFLLNPWFLLSLIFWVIALILVYLLRNKKGATYLFFPLLVMFKTRKLNNFIKRISRRAPKFWRVFWTIGIFISFGFTIYAFYFFFTNFVNLIFNPRPEQAIILLIPGVTLPLPLVFYLILPLLFILTTHEFAHGISASADGIDVKSTGVLGAGLFYIIGFGAFVEVDERELNSSKIHRNTRLRIAAAGTYINGITAGIAFLLILSYPFFISPYYRQVTQVSEVLTEDKGGYNYGNLSTGDVLLALKHKGDLDNNYIYINEFKKITLTTILTNETSLQVSIGDNLTLKIYDPSLDIEREKNITLGPRYYLGIRYDYIPNGTEIRIYKIFSESEDGNNYDKNLIEGMMINKINGISINQTNGDTIEKVLTNFNLLTLNLSTDTETFILDVDTVGVVIGIYSNLYYMPLNDVAKLFTSAWPDFILKEISWLFVIAFSITLFNMLPLPVFDGDRIVKELINWGIGEDYQSLKKKTDKFIYKKEEKEIPLSEYRVENIDYIKINLKNQEKIGEQSNIILSEENYSLIDKIGDGFKDSVALNLPEQSKLEEGSLFEISYHYWHDKKRKIKKSILNSIRYITLFIVIGNFVLSFVKFGGLLFWV